MTLFQRNEPTASHRDSAKRTHPGSFLAIIICLLFPSLGKAIELEPSGPPAVTSQGNKVTALWSNVGTLDGVEIDLEADVINLTGKPDYNITSENGDFKFQFINGTLGQTRTATVRWSFFVSGTTIPIVLPDFAFTVDDLDDGNRSESLTTSDAYDYQVNRPTLLAHSMSDGTVSAAGSGGIENNPGDPKAAVKLLFQNRNSVVIAYRTVFNAVTVSAFHHNGNDKFKFGDPNVRLHYTFDFNNREKNAIKSNFDNTLPSGLFWDPAYSPSMVGSLSGGTPVYSEGNRRVSITGLMLPRGKSSLTLRTIKTIARGTFQNKAEITPTAPVASTLEAEASVDLR